jgi:hypothetical protein
MKWPIVVFILGSAGCSLQLVDPCAGVTGTCLAIQVDSSAKGKQVDQLSLGVTGDGVSMQQTVSDGKVLTLPVAIGVLFDSLPNSPVDLKVAVTVTRSGQVNRFGSAHAQLTRGQHQNVSVQVDDSAPRMVGLDLGAVSVDSSASNIGGDDLESEDASDLAPDTTPILPRLISPLSTSTVTSQQPTFKWSIPLGATGVQVDLCRDSACTNEVATPVAVDASGTSGTPTAALPAGALFWRVSVLVAGIRQRSATWEFWVGTRTATKTSTSFGTVLDVNGDGYADVIVGARHAKDAAGNANAGRTYCYLGGPGGLATTPQLLDGRDGAGALFGLSVASVGDVNGDGYADVIVGAYGAKGAAGRAYLYLGSPGGLATTPHLLDGPDGPSASFGIAVASAGDVNGDGYADVIVGADNAKDAAGNAHAGRAYLYLGGPGGLATTPQLLDGRDGGDARFGSSIASAGDVNGDGYADVVVGARLAKDAAGNSEAGRAYLYLGGPAGLATTPQLLDGRDGADALFGSSIASAGDVNGDGYADVIVDAFDARDAAGNAEAGRAYLYLGGPGGLTTTPQLLDGRDGAHAYFGSVASAGDVNGDGYADVIVGAVGANDAAGHPFAGRAYLYLGGSGGLTMTPQLLDGRDGANAFFGSSVASADDVKGDGYASAARLFTAAVARADANRGAASRRQAASCRRSHPVSPKPYQEVKRELCFQHIEDSYAICSHVAALLPT